MRKINIEYIYKICLFFIVIATIYFGIYANIYRLQSAEKEELVGLFAQRIPSIDTLSKKRQLLEIKRTGYEVIYDNNHKNIREYLQTVLYRLANEESIHIRLLEIKIRETQNKLIEVVFIMKGEAKEERISKFLSKLKIKKLALRIENIIISRKQRSQESPLEILIKGMVLII